MKLVPTLATFAATLFSTAVVAEDKPILGSRSFLDEGNNNSIIEHQYSEGDYLKPGDVGIDFYGHMAFKITSPNGITMVIDPWRNDPTGVFGVWYPEEFPEVSADIAISSHAHFDHDAVYRVKASMNLERIAGVFHLGDVKITGFADKHQCHAPGEVNWTAYLKSEFHLDLEELCPENAPRSWDNVIYVIETGGMKIGFWGDNRPDPDPHLFEQLEDLDVMIMNIDGSGHILSYEQVNDILDRIKPRSVIPGHYLQVGTVLDSSTLKSADEWVYKNADVVALNSASLTVNKALLEGAQGRVYYFGDNVKKD
ncbi:hypothetical protein NBRC116590_17270 [Pelagimonas sp. KU-00592-HH]|uniref:MBL fold metallo-hydrolase n=1 Tax=Pelagimonas sp. KU-00592-HH TaxID=3127651 RepID=UPI00310AFBB1